MIFYDLPTGYGSLTLWLLGGPTCRPAAPYMGSKWKHAAYIADTAGIVGGRAPNRVVLADAGCPGWVWPELLTVERGAAVAEHFLDWRGRDPVQLWNDLRDQPPDPDPARRAAQVLWLQARTASATPIQWDGTAWVMATGSRQSRARPNTSKLLVQRGQWERYPVSQRGCKGLVYPETMARRVTKIAGALARHHVTFHHGDLGDVIPAGDLTGHVFYLDPDYVGCTSYGFTVGRDRLLALALDLAARGARVVISEAEPLPLPGWFHVNITRNKPEWLTCSHPPRHRQAQLFAPSR